MPASMPPTGTLWHASSRPALHSGPHMSLQLLKILAIKSKQSQLISPRLNRSFCICGRSDAQELQTALLAPCAENYVCRQRRVRWHRWQWQPAGCCECC